MPNVLVVGGAGYIGGHLTDQLLVSGMAVRLYDMLLFEERYLKPVEFVNGDIRDTAKLGEHLKWANVVVWLAALVGDPVCAISPEVTRAINVGALQWLVDHFDGRIVFMSSCSVYGAQDELLDETSPVDPLSLYAETKLEGEAILANANAISFRNGTIYGLGDTHSRIRLDLVVNLLTVKAMTFRRIHIFGGRQYRPMLHVKDVADAVVKNIDSEHRGIFNLASENMTIMEVAAIIHEEIPDVELVRSESQFQDTRNYRVSCELARKTFGFSPRYTVRDGIREIKAMVEEQRIMDLTSSRYLNADFLRPRLMQHVSPLGVEYNERFM